MADPLDTSTPIDPLLLRRLAGLPPLVPAGLAITGREIPVVRPGLAMPKPVPPGEAPNAPARAVPLEAPTTGLTPTGLDISRLDTGSSLSAGPARPALRPATLTPPDPNDPRYQLHGGKKVLTGILGGLAGLGGHLDVARSLNPYDRAVDAYKQNLTLEDTASQIAERRGLADRAEAAANKPEKQTPEDQAFSDLLANGSSPLDAYRQVKQAGEKPAAPGGAEEQAFADLVKKGTDPLEAFKQVKQAGEKPAATTYEHATIENPAKPGTPKEALFDRTKGQYLDPDTKQPIAGAKPYEKPNKEKTAGEDAFSRGLSESAVKDVTTARAADFRYRTMTDSLPKAMKGDQQAMLNLLTNHIGMTLGLQKGARITKDILREATESAPFLARVESKFDKQGYLSGVTLTADQMKSMMDLAVQQRRLAWQQARESGQQAGVEDKIQFPKDLAGQGALNADEARDYLQKAGGDKAKARDLAKQDGRTF